MRNFHAKIVEKKLEQSSNSSPSHTFATYLSHYICRQICFSITSNSYAVLRRDLFGHPQHIWWPNKAILYRRFYLEFKTSSSYAITTCEDYSYVYLSVYVIHFSLFSARFFLHSSSFCTLMNCAYVVYGSTPLALIFINWHRCVDV